MCGPGLDLCRGRGALRAARRHAEANGLQLELVDSRYRGCPCGVQIPSGEFVAQKHPTVKRFRRTKTPGRQTISLHRTPRSSNQKVRKASSGLVQRICRTVLGPRRDTPCNDDQPTQGAPHRGGLGAGRACNFLYPLILLPPPLRSHKVLLAAQIVSGGALLWRLQ